MNEKNLRQAGNQLKAFVRGLTAGQRLTLFGGAIVVAAVLIAFVLLTGKPDMKVLYSGLATNDMQSVTAQLSAKQIPYDLGADGASVRVPADQLDKARLLVASQGAPQSGRLGFEIFDKPNWASSDFGEQVNYQRAMEGELERTLVTIHGVQNARVHLVMPKDSLFSDQQKQAKASVALQLSGSQLDRETGRAITNLVASAVDGLRPENVTVVDGNGHLLIRDDTLQHANDIEKELTDKVVLALTPIVGSDHVQANVNIEYDMSTGESTTEGYDPNSVVAINKDTSEERRDLGEAAGVAGTSSNIPGKQVAANVKITDPGRIMKTENANYVVNKTVTHTVQPAGKLKRITAAVLLDDTVHQAVDGQGKVTETRQKRSPEEIKQIEELVKASIGFDAARGDVVVVENMAFQNSAPTIVPTSLPDRVQQTAEKWSTTIRYGLLLLIFIAVYLLVLRPVQRQFVNTFRLIPAQLSAAGAPAAAIAMNGEGNAELIQPVGEMEPGRAVLLKRQLVEKVKKEPENAGRLVLNWIKQGETSK